MGKGFFQNLKSRFERFLGSTLCVFAFTGLGLLPLNYSLADAPAAPTDYDTVSVDPYYRDEGKPGSTGVGFAKQYLTDSERAQYAIDFKREGKNGVWVDAAGKPLDGEGIFVMDRKGNFYFKRDPTIEEFQHSSFFAGKPVAGAGEFFFFEGRLMKMNRNSGHYLPTAVIGHQVLLEVHRKGVDLDRVTNEYSDDFDPFGRNKEPLRTSEIFENYQALREGSYEEAKKAVLSLSEDLRGRGMLNKEFAALMKLQNVQVQKRYVQLIEDLVPLKKGNLRVLENGYVTLDWNISEDEAFQRLQKFWALQKELPSNSTNLKLLLRSLDDAFTWADGRPQVLAALARPELSELKKALLKVADPTDPFAEAMSRYRTRVQPSDCLFKAVKTI